MGTRRRWRDFPGRLRKELEGTSAIAGVGGVGLGAAGWGILAPPFTFIVVGVGGAITLSALAFAGYRAIPPKLLDPSDLVGIEIDLDELENKIKKNREGSNHRQEPSWKNDTKKPPKIRCRENSSH